MPAACIQGASGRTELLGKRLRFRAGEGAHVDAREAAAGPDQRLVQVADVRQVGREDDLAPLLRARSAR
jgi:hypothetical protein